MANIQSFPIEPPSTRDLNPKSPRWERSRKDWKFLINIKMNDHFTSIFLMTTCMATIPHLHCDGSLLIEVVKALLEPIRIILSLFRCISPLFFEIRPGGREGFASNERCDVIRDVIRLVFSRVPPQRLPRSAVYQKLLEIGLNSCASAFASLDMFYNFISSPESSRGLGAYDNFLQATSRMELLLSRASSPCQLEWFLAYCPSHILIGL